MHTCNTFTFPKQLYGREQESRLTHTKTRLPTVITDLSISTGREKNMYIKTVHTITGRACTHKKLESNCPGLITIINNTGQWDYSTVNGNTSTTQPIVVISRSRVKPQVSASISSTPVATVNSAKYLRVTITSDLRWNFHILNTCKSAKQKPGSSTEISSRLTSELYANSTRRWSSLSLTIAVAFGTPLPPLS